MYTLDEIYRQFNSQVFNHVKRVVRNFHDSEDITTDVFIKIQRLNEKESTKFNPEKSSLSTWIYTITNSVILDFFRTNHQDRYQAVSDFIDNEGNEVFNFVAPKNEQADSKVLTDELHKKIVKAFHNLSLKYRRIATLYFIREYKYEEIAEMVNVPIGTVKAMISRSREKLQAELNGIYDLKKTNI